MFVAFGLCFLGVALLVARRSATTDIDEFIVAGRRLPFGLISASVLVSWLWTTSLLGAAEAGYLYGVGGGFAFAFGSAIPFFIFIPLAVRLRKVMPQGTTFLEFVRQRYGRITHTIFVGLMLLLALYICTEQIVGIAYAVSGAYNVPYAAVAVCAAAVVVGYITIAGLRGAVINDVIQFVVISLTALVLLPIVLNGYGVHHVYDGLQHVATDSNAGNHLPGAATFWAAAAARYFAVAMVVSFGFVLLNQGYYSKARAASNSRSLLRAYIVGTVVAWLPIPILFGVVLGGVGLAEGLAVGDELSVSTDVSSYVITQHFGGFGVLVFALVIFMAGLTTAGNTLAGFQATVAVDVQDDLLRRERTAQAKKRAIRLATVVFGVIVCGCAVALEGFSLLRFDILSGILFATAVGPLVLGMTFRRPTGGLAVSAIVVGLVCGLATYLLNDNPDVDYFYGNLVSLLVPFVIVGAGSVFSSQRYDFAVLARYRSNHHRSDAPEEKGP